MKLFTNEILALRLHIPSEKCDIKSPLPLLWPISCYCDCTINKMIKKLCWSQWECHQLLQKGVFNPLVRLLMVESTHILVRSCSLSLLQSYNHCPTLLFSPQLCWPWGPPCKSTSHPLPAFSCSMFSPGFAPSKNQWFCDAHKWRIRGTITGVPLLACLKGSV